MIADDPILGPVRLCSSCGEWWPDDEEFYYRPLGSYHAKRQCRACIIEKRVEWRQIHREQRNAAERSRYLANLDRPLRDGMGRPRKSVA